MSPHKNGTDNLSDIDTAWVKAWGYVLRALSHSLDNLETEAREAYAEIDNKNDPEKRARVEQHARGVQWANKYEWPTKQSILLCIAAFIPPRMLLSLIAPWNFPKWLKAFHDNEDIVLDYDPPLGALPKILGNTRALLSQVRAFLAFHRSMSDLIADARDDNDDDALFLAIRVDPAVLVGKTGARRLQLAVAVNDQPFITRLTTALREPLETEFQHARLQAALVIMAKTHHIHRLNEHNAATLFIEETKLYTKHGAKDAQRSLWRYIQRWKKQHATIIRKKMSS